jgi:hypothetical protein
VKDHLFQISLRSRCTATLAGLRTLNPDAARATQVGAFDLLRHDALGAEPTPWANTRATFGNVFVKAAGEEKRTSGLPPRAKAAPSWERPCRYRQPPSPRSASEWRDVEGMVQDSEECKAGCLLKLTTSY